MKSVVPKHQKTSLCPELDSSQSNLNPYRRLLQRANSCFRWARMMPDQEVAKELEQMGNDAEQALRDALAGKPSAEVKRRVRELLGKLTGDDSPRVRCWSRAVFVLEQIGTPEARKVLEALAKGESGERATQDAGV